MHLELIDWIIIIAYLAISLVIGLAFKNRAGKSMADFFVGGRRFPWYLAGISMVATTFAADTPLAVTELVAKYGIAGNWLWWNMLLGGMLTTFFFAHLWRRAGILTEPEFIELRYSGKPAAFLRGFKAVYLGLIMNCLIIAWVNLAMITILEGFFGLYRTDAMIITAGIMLLTAIYSAISGLWGVAVTDAVQFVIAMVSCIILAILVVNSGKIGGIEGLTEKLPEHLFSFFPVMNTGSVATDTAGILVLSVGTFLAYMCIWWASWYPGAEPGGGGYIVQRMISAKNEKHSVYATLFFQIAHYCLRPWPWIIVGLCTLILYPDLDPDHKRLGYVLAMKEFLPTGLKGLLLVAFLAAYMSTLATQLNWGTSYLINDLYKRFIKIAPGTGGTTGQDRHYIFAARTVTILVMIVSLVVTSFIETISGVWTFIIECGAGLGLVLILRWYWWRINVWSEITATVAPFLFYAISKLIFKIEFPESFFITVGGTTLSWLVVTYLTRPETGDLLAGFYSKVQPGGWWEPVAKITTVQVTKKDRSMYILLVSWISATAMTYSALFTTGYLLFHSWSKMILGGIIFLLSLTVLVYAMAKSSVISK